MALDTIETIMSRRSIRKYQPDEILEGDLRTIVEAGRQAPSAANRQPWHFVVVKDPDLKQKVAAACSEQTWMAQAHLIIAAVGLPAASEKWFAIDTTIALQTMVLAAHSLGYGTCWIGSFDEEEVKGLLGLPAGLEVICLTPMGVPAAHPEARDRKDLSEVFSLDEYGRPLT